MTVTPPPAAFIITTPEKILDLHLDIVKHLKLVEEPNHVPLETEIHATSCAPPSVSHSQFMFIMTASKSL